MAKMGKRELADIPKRVFLRSQLEEAGLGRGTHSFFPCAFEM